MLTACIPEEQKTQITCTLHKNIDIMEISTDLLQWRGNSSTSDSPKKICYPEKKVKKSKTYFNETATDIEVLVLMFLNLKYPALDFVIYVYFKEVFLE